MNKDLKVIENELVPVYKTSTGEKVVYGTELYAVLEVKSKFADWVKNRLNDCEGVEKEDFEAFSKNLENGGRIKEYIIKLDIAKEMAMLERNEKGTQVRRYFIQIEKKYKEKKKQPSAIEQLQLQRDAILEVNEKVGNVEQRVEKLENNMTITHEQIQVIKNRVNKKVTHILGGYESNAYKDKRLRGKAYSRFNKDYCNYFRINARANTLTSKFDEALRYIDLWEPDTNMKLMIQYANAQIKMDIA